VLNREMSVASSLFYQRRCVMHACMRQASELRNSPQFGFCVVEKQIVVSNKPLLLSCFFK
jgi:hypothetical protein